MTAVFRPLALLLAALLPCLAGHGAAAAYDIQPEVRRHVLDNGLTLLMVERHQAPVISSVITYRVGSADEPSGATGIAHLFEHMAFKGTRRIGVTDARAEAPLLDEIDRLVLERAAAAPAPDPEALAALDGRIATLSERARTLVVPNQFGDLYLRQGATGLNASTGADVTTYYVSFPANRLPFWAAIEADRMANPVLREFYAERDVVLEERRMRVDDNPGGRLYEALLASAFVAHPYGNPTIGWPSDLDHLTRPQAAAFFARYYVPANTVIALVGDFDPDEAIRLVERSFGRLPRRGAPPAPHTVEPDVDGERRVTVRHDANPQLSMAFHRPAVTDPDDVVFDVIQIILSDGPSSRLHRRLVLDARIATGVTTGGGVPGYRAPNLFVLNATPRHPHTTAEVEAALQEELERLKTEPVTARELTMAQNQAEAALIRRLGNNAGMAQSLAYSEAVAGDWRLLFTMQQRIAAVTPDDVMRVARGCFDPNRRIVAELVPTHPDAPAGEGDR
ncbi:MAG: insulinase family protein [Nitrospirae bacterium]|nr:insulinase family protein [Nitrospirota bacterium]